MDSYTFRVHLNAVIIGLRRLAELDMLAQPEYAREAIAYLTLVETMSGVEHVAVSQALLTMAGPLSQPAAGVTPTTTTGEGE